MINKISGFTNEISNSKVESPKGMGFGELMKDKLDETNEKMIVADEKTQALIRGEDIELHEVMLATAEAKLSLDLAIEVRNKLVDAYKEFNNMQI